MAMSYDDWMDNAKEQKRYLDAALSINNSQKIIYHRGKYLYALKRAYKLNNHGIVPAEVSFNNAATYLVDELKSTFAAHNSFIESEISKNKANSSIENRTLSQELGLKIKRLSTRASEVSFASTNGEKEKLVKSAGKSSLSLLGTVAKAPLMVATNVASKVGPLAVTIVFLPFKLLSTLFRSSLNTVFEIKEDKKNKGPYDHKVIDTISDGLGKAVKKAFEASYKGLGKL